MRCSCLECEAKRTFTKVLVRAALSGSWFGVWVAFIIARLAFWTAIYGVVVGLSLWAAALEFKRWRRLSYAARHQRLYWVPARKQRHTAAEHHLAQAMAAYRDAERF